MNSDPKPNDIPIRTACFEENGKLNSLLGKLSAILKPVQNELSFEYPHHPVGSIVGNPRSGSTLLLQWLASLGAFSYPTNLLTRFAYAPYIGALTQKMLFDPEYDYHGDFQNIQSGINFDSDLGKSKGAMACNEFQHFFRNHMPNFELEWLDAKAMDSVDCSGILQGLASIEAALEKPFVTKANILQFNLDYFAGKLPNLIWIYITRDPIYVMQSILIAREHYYGNRNSWWSVRPKEYNLLKSMDVHHQIAGQVYFTEQAIDRGLCAIPEIHKISVDYESFCSSPASVYRQLINKYAKLGCDLPCEYSGAESFKCNNTIRLPEEDIQRFQMAYREFENGLLDTIRSQT